MDVPGAVPIVPLHLDEARTRFDQPPSHEQRLPEETRSVFGSRRFLLARQVEGFAHLRRSQHGDGPLLRGVHFLDGRTGIGNGSHLVDGGQQIAATAEAIGRHVRGENEVRQLHLGAGRIGDFDGIVGTAENAAADAATVEKFTAEVDVRRHRPGWPLQLGDDSTVCGQTFERTGQNRPRCVSAGEAGQRTDQGTAVHALGHHRQQLADAQARCAGGRAGVGAAHIDRRSGFGIEHLKLTGTAFQKDEDARSLRRTPLRCCLRAERIRQTNAKDAQTFRPGEARGD